MSSQLEKIGGYCFAGKEVFGKGYGGWIRPVSEREGEEISGSEQKFADGDSPEILDVVTIPMMEPKPVHHQRENHLIDSTSLWEKTGVLDRRDLPALLDDVSDDLWGNASSTKHGNNDRVSVAHAQHLENSLLLIQPESLTIIVQFETYQGSGQRPKVRADFTYNRRNYRLMVTDPVAENKYQQKNLRERLGEYSIAVDDMYLCVSLGESYHGYCYKLVAALIGDAD